MNRRNRVTLAEETLAIIENGQYQSSNGKTVSLEADVKRCINETRYYMPEDLEALQLPSAGEGVDATIEVVNETTLSGARRLVKAGFERVGVLNFASARNPGGGFLGGSQAQEESLARSSALYVSLQSCMDYYSYHRAKKSGLYSDRMIYSPACPVFREDSGELLDRVYKVDFLTSPAPNAGAIEKNSPKDRDKIPVTFDGRIEKALSLFLSQVCDALVLGAWGCGVFRNDPVLVARLFAKHLSSGSVLRTGFNQVVFSVFDNTEGQSIYGAFRSELEPSASH